MKKPRLYLDYGTGYIKDKANTSDEIIKKLEQVHTDIYKYLIVQEIDKCDKVIALGFGNLEEIHELGKTLRKERNNGK